LTRVLHNGYAQGMTVIEFHCALEQTPRAVNA